MTVSTDDHMAGASVLAVTLHRIWPVEDAGDLTAGEAVPPKLFFIHIIEIEVYYHYR